MDSFFANENVEWRRSAPIEKVVIIMNIQFLIGPVIGLIIGYVTNNIAIKMLFRPLKPVYIGKRRVPFTPGLIPKEKERIAKTIGGVVSTELFGQRYHKQDAFVGRYNIRV